jgi:hypothetical protein
MAPLDRAAIPEEGLIKYGYIPEKYRDALIAILTGFQDALPKSLVFRYSNFLPGKSDYLYWIADAIEDGGVFLGGPDILPYREGLRDTSYPVYEKYKDRLTLFCSAQGDSYKNQKNDTDVDDREPVPAEGFSTMEEKFLFARDLLNVSYLFWDCENETSETGQRTNDDAIAVIRK